MKLFQEEKFHFIIADHNTKLFKLPIYDRNVPPGFWRRYSYPAPIKYTVRKPRLATLNSYSYNRVWSTKIKPKYHGYKCWSLYWLETGASLTKTLQYLLLKRYPTDLHNRPAQHSHFTIGANILHRECITQHSTYIPAFDLISSFTAKTTLLSSCRAGQLIYSRLSPQIG